ncbi:MAG: symmetrical bis(5'-nucleosyl)-tetraphosphatase [Kordiimonadaceae bacterium]|jgi:bis(5'-nucleosyl)-tetraphosphatase (symmetrical)|nr:symmetrical bis(5'-nucleosyl)-tetraphosphatase [Pseudomonadota bacterium]MBT6329779.1 symmetrical bis(5'-nucleosyl)-tetraphosphatase [Kordiimonadaceae bacterium]
MHYVIGDLQGCYDELRRLLDKLSFNDSTDRITFTGDLVNRGPKSKAALKFVVENRHCMDTVLGNHDLHFLSMYCGVRQLGSKDTLQALLDDDGVEALVSWLRQQPFCIEAESRFLISHAGLYPLWTPQEALLYSNELSDVLQSQAWCAFLEQMYGNTPDSWNPRDTNNPRRRFLINAFTRMRFIDNRGRLDFKHKGDSIIEKNNGLIPWYDHPAPANNTHIILFGHWSAIGAKKRDTSISLDGGCVWGGELCAVNLHNLRLTCIRGSLY